MTHSQDILNLLIRSVAGASSEILPADFSDWKDVIDISFNQGVAAVSIDGYSKLGPSAALESAEMKLEKYKWYGSVIMAESSYSEHKRCIDSLKSLFESYGIKMMLLKGYGLSLNYPVPEHRPVGDMDIYCFGDYDRANRLIEAHGITVDYSHHKHSVFTYKGTVVENHHTFLNIHGHKSTAEIEEILEGLRVTEPTPDFNALYLLRHMGEHFASVDMSLRHLLDWGFFMRTHGREINREWYMNCMERVGMKRFLGVVDAVCVDYLGFSEADFIYVDYDKTLEKRIIDDIFHPEFSEAIPKGYLSGIAFKMRRWYANGWKHDLVFKESRLSSFLTQTWGHLLKPASLRN